MIDYELSPIGDEVRKQLEDLKSKAPETDAVDAEALEEELGRIQFKPEHATDIADTEVVVGGVKKPAHVVRNFLMITNIVNNIMTGQMPDGPSFEAAYAEAAEERKYLEVYGRLREIYPTLYAYLAALYTELQKQRQQRKDEPYLTATNLMNDEERYRASQAYEAAAQIARELDPQYNLRNLYA